MKKLLVIDGNSILNRAYYGIRPLKTQSGQMTNAIYGMVNMTERYITMVEPDYLAVAFDVHQPTFRHQFSSDYKATRHGMPDDLASQLDLAKESVKLMGATVLEAPGFEADDILGTLSRMAEKEDVEAYIATGDRDSLQLISEKTKVILATNSEPIVYDKAAFFEKYGVDSTQFVDVKALMGDSSDNIPGVPGIGEKTAFKLIADYGSLDNIYDGLEEKPLTKGVIKKLTDGKQSAYDSQFLARIKCDVPLSVTLADVAYNGPHKEELAKLFNELEFYAFIKRFHLETEEKKAELKETCCAVSEIPFDTENNYGIAFDFENDKAAVCVGETVYTVCGIATLQAYLDGPYHFTVYDEKTALHSLAPMKIDFTACRDDIMLMAYIAAVTDNDFSFDKLTQYLLNTKAETLAEKAYDTVLLREKLREELEKTNQYCLYEEVEFPLCRVLFEMERDGFSVDVKALQSFSVQLEKMQEEYAERIYDAAGEVFNINSPKQLGHILFEKLGMPHAKKTKTGYSTNAEVLERLRPYAPIVDDILEYRQFGKLKSTYADGLVAAADSENKVHTSFRQALTATGRLSSTEPNLQNIPVKTELGREFRKFFIARNDDYVLIDADYSQIELRLLAAISEDEHMIDAFINGFDIHSSTAMRVFGVSKEDVTIELRKKAKAINFGIMYGMGDFSLASDLHISRADAKAYIDSYLGAYPKVHEYLGRVVEEAKKDGYVTTLFGRRRYIPELASARKMEVAFGERVAMNSPIQGTAADIIKLAMVNIRNKLKEGNYDAHLILQVHDELMIEANKNCAAEVTALLKEEMEHAVSLAVPLTVEIASGRTWYDAK